MKKKNLVVSLLICFCMIFSTVMILTACKKNCIHTYSDWVVTTNYTCTTDGVKTRTCTKCNYTETEIIPASHTITHVDIDPADCTNTGTLAHEHCSVCDKNFIDGVEKSNEQLIIPVGDCYFLSVAKVAPTCTESGVLAHLECKGCHKNIIKDVEYTDQELIIPATHNLVTIDAKEKTCFEDGHLAYTVCRSCNKIFINNEEKELEDTILPHSHVMEHNDLKNATCTDEGMLEHDYCKDCAQYYVGEEVKNYFDLIIPCIADHEHDYGELISATENEMAHYTCSICNKNFNEDKEEISSLDKLHDHEFINKYACGNGVWRKYSKCSVCGYKTEESTYDIPYKLEAVCPFIVGRHTLSSTFDRTYKLKVYTSTSGPYYEKLKNMIPEYSNFYTRLQELEDLVASGDTGSFPLTETFTFKCELYEQQVTITFDIERKTAQFTQPVYPKATDIYWGNKSLGDFTVKFSSNFYDYTNECYETDYVKLSETNITSSGWCSELYERNISGYNDTRVNVIYDDCNPFGMIAGDFGEITSLSKHTSQMASNSTIVAFDSLSELFATFMSNFEIPTDGTEYIPTISSDALDDYTEFYNKAIELYNSSLVSFTKNVNNDITRSAVIGVNLPYTMAFGTDVSPELIDFQTVIANLFGFSSKKEFMNYAQTLANTYAQHRTNITNFEATNEALENGCFYTENGSFVFPIAVANELESVVLAYVIVDTNGLVSVWVNDITAVLWATNFNSSYHTDSIINNELHCKNILFVTGPFDINADWPEGKKYIIRFIYNEQVYIASFVYISDKYVIQEIRSIATEICCGEEPDVDLRYANGSCSSLNFKKLKVIDGKFDKNTPGVYTVTFATLDGYAKPVTVTITVRNKKDVKEIFNKSTYYMAKGSNGFEVQVEYFDGTYGYEWIPLASIVEYEGEKLDGTKVGSYKVVVKIGDRSKKVDVNVYDSATKIITNISPSIDGAQSLVWTKDNDNNIKYDLNGLYIKVEYNNGTYEILPITEEMISCQEDGDNIIVEVTYLDKTCTFNAVIGDKTATGYTLDCVFVGKDLAQYEYYGSSGLKFIIMAHYMEQYRTCVLDETYTLQLSNGSNVFYIDLTPDMLYINDEYGMYGYDGKVDLATIKAENYDSAYIMYNDEIIADITLVIYDKNEVFSEIYFNNDSAQLIIGSQAEIIEQLKGKSYYYTEIYDFDIWSDKEIYREYLEFSDFKLGDISNIKFNKCGNVRIPIIYRNRTTYLEVQLIPNLDLYTSKFYTNQYGAEFILYSNGYYETNNSQSRIIGTYEFMNTAKNIVFMHDLPYSDYGEAVYMLNDDTQKILDLRMENVEGFTKIGTFSDMCYALFTLYENDGVYYGEMFGKYYDSEGTHTEYICTLPIDYDPVKERIYMWNAEYVIGEYDEENECFPIEIPMAGKTKYEYVDTEYGKKWAYNDNGVAYYCVFYNNNWHCVSFWDWRYNEDQTKINEYYYDLDELSNVVDISILTEVTE